MADEATSTTATSAPEFIAPAAVAETSGDNAATAETATAKEGDTATDLQNKFEAQQKVNRDLERKLKDARAGVERVSELESTIARLEGKESEYQAAQAAQAVRDEALAGANTRILKAEVRAAAAGKLNDPNDALLHLDLSEFEVGKDGEVDTSQIAKAIDTLIESKSYLAAQSGSRFQGSGDGGTRNGSSPSIDDQIAEAMKAGNHQLAIALKQQRSAELLAKKS